MGNDQADRNMPITRAELARALTIARNHTLASVAMAMSVGGPDFEKSLSFFQEHDAEYLRLLNYLQGDG